MHLVFAGGCTAGTNMRLDCKTMKLMVPNLCVPWKKRFTLLDSSLIASLWLFQGCRTRVGNELCPNAPFDSDVGGLTPRDCAANILEEVD